jgi:hypothetical protein
MSRANAKTAAAAARTTAATMDDETNRDGLVQQQPHLAGTLQELDFTKLFKPKGMKDIMGTLEPTIVRGGFPLETCQALGTTSALWLDRLVRKCIPQASAQASSSATSHSNASGSSSINHRIITIDTIRAVVDQDESLHFLVEILDQVEEEMDKKGSNSSTTASSLHLLTTTKKTCTRKRAPTSTKNTTTTTTSGKRKRAAKKNDSTINDFDDDDDCVKNSAIVQEAAANTSATQKSKQIVQDLDDYD